VIILFLGSGTLITLHLVAGFREIQKDNIKFHLQRKGFVMVCDVNDIEEDRAKMFCLNKERIAVYKTAGKLFAVSNVCKHQNGPLGEGKIIDGCITCPWHGYQYLPHNGQSPPPFKEKVSTYDVKLEGPKIWVNPAAYPEGTERPGATITTKQKEKVINYE
jgi:nitrite reductase/ring-hydroxylating ferredoxin subunit